MVSESESAYRRFEAQVLHNERNVNVKRTVFSLV
jgi:hypothetical protein